MPIRHCAARRATTGTFAGIALVGAALAGVAAVACSDVARSAEDDADALAQLTLREEMRIGSADDPDTGFAAITGVDVDRDGNVYVFEPQAVHIRVYDTTGSLVRTIGRKGSGPGEFERSSTFGVAGDTVWAFDSFSRRLTMFDRRGNVLAAHRVEGLAVNLQGPRSIGYVLPRYMRDDGTFVGLMTLFTGSRGAGEWPVKATDTVAVPRLLFTASGEIRDTIGWDPRLPRVESERVEWVEVGSTRYTVPRPPPRSALMASLIDGRVAVDVEPLTGADAAWFRVTRLGLDGDTVFTRRYRYRPKPYTRQMLDSIVWRSVRMPGGGMPIVGGIARPLPTRSDSTAAFEAISARLSFPEHQLPVERVEVHGNGIWLLRENAEHGAPWMLIDDEGRARGLLRLPVGAWVRWSRGDTVWASVPDDLDVPWLVRYRIVREDEATGGAR